MRQIIFLLIFISLLNSISATCNSSQININLATISDLDKLDGIGSVKAQAIIDSRPYLSLDDLLNVKGIGNITLEKIKFQNLACIGENSPESSSIPDISYETPNSISESSHENYVAQNSEIIDDLSLEAHQTIQSESIINLNQEVKTEQNKQTVYESKTEKIRKYSIYGFAFFLIFLVIVLLIKN